MAALLTQPHPTAPIRLACRQHPPVAPCLASSIPQPAPQRLQDEYCEWSVDRNAEGKITRISVTCEGPEYWAYLAATQPDTVVQASRGTAGAEAAPVCPGHGLWSDLMPSLRGLGWT